LYASTYNDKILSCVDCRQEFSFPASEQQFYAEKQFSEPRRCASCRAAKKAARGESGGSSYGSSYGSGSGSSYGGGSASGYGSAGGYGGQREMFTATCDGCGGEARVPFRPTGSKPVYCSNCFSTRR
jgi:CxxC-x17-CxxC domain-containing protein